MIYRRLILAFLVITLLGTAGGALGLLLTSRATAHLNTLQQNTSLIQQAQRLQINWYAFARTMDSLLLARAASSLDSVLLTQVATFNAQADQLAEQLVAYPPESAERAAQNQTLIDELSQITSDLGNTIDEFRQLTNTGRWGSASTIRQTTLEEQQKRLDSVLVQLSANLQAEADEKLLAAREAQRLALISWLTAAIIALFISFLVTWNTGRQIASPIQLLIKKMKIESWQDQTFGQSTSDSNEQQVQKPEITAKENIQAAKYSQQQNEIGNLWRAFNLMTTWLGESYANLEQRVLERTRSLEERTQQMQTAAEVARDITLSRDLEALLTNTVTLLHRRFGYYHVSIFLVDDRRENMVLRAAAGEAAKQMLAERPSLKLNRRNISRQMERAEYRLVGEVCQSGQPQMALHEEAVTVNEGEDFRLPEMRAEMALPLKIVSRRGALTNLEGLIIGALYVQSKEQQAFDQESMTILQIIADQLATAIESAQLMSELEKRLQELEKFYTSYGRQAWERFAHSRLAGYEYDGTRAKAFGSARTPSQTGSLSGSAKRSVRFPIELRGQRIGDLEVWPRGEGLNEDESQVLTMISERLSQILESARLFGEAQQRAAREEALNELTANVVRALDPQSVLQSAALQLGKLAFVQEVEVRLVDQEERSKGDAPDAEGSLV